MPTTNTFLVQDPSWAKSHVSLIQKRNLPRSLTSNDNPPTASSNGKAKTTSRTAETSSSDVQDSESHNSSAQNDHEQEQSPQLSDSQLAEVGDDILDIEPDFDSLDILGWLGKEAANLMKSVELSQKGELRKDRLAVNPLVNEVVFLNKDGDMGISSLYRWVTKIEFVKSPKYSHRFEPMLRSMSKDITPEKNSCFDFSCWSQNINGSSWL